MENLEELYKRYAHNVYQYLLAQTHDPDVAEEVTQETFYQAVKSIHRYDGSCKVTTWLCAIAKNQLLIYKKKHAFTEPLEKEIDDETISVMDQIASAPSAEEQVLTAEGRVTILKQLHRLKEPYREILHLRIFGDLSFREIGEIFGKTENWARVSFYRGKEQLLKEMESERKS